ncbi:MAG: hypothetical protein EWV48_08640 [Microcystis aeruginosa Ma_QC_C_20070823_S13]|nr:MAG: hypothetical protein EWV56_20820 [Microcystis aeruginosa Ma_QC_C_20070823_S13D]TRU62930.1 MAG: hypothetical protein EWV48_08640 [Microcystis aeruginosa Ma_QC_C_20070823_S13]
MVGFHPVSQTEGLHPTFKIKTKHPDVDFMEFAGMAADIENTMQKIVEVRAKHSDDNLSLKP